MREIKDLQKLIEDRARQQLSDDLDVLFDPIQRSPLMKNLPAIFNLYCKQTPESDRVAGYEPNRFFYWSNRYRTSLHEYWLPVYIERESKKLLEKVDRLSTEVEDLLTFKERKEAEE